MDAVMGAGLAMYSFLLNGLDIVAMTSTRSAAAPIPSGARYGVIVGMGGIMLPFPVCIKVGVPGEIYVIGLMSSGGALGVQSYQFTLNQGTYHTHEHVATIIWFG